MHLVHAAQTAPIPDRRLRRQEASHYLKDRWGLSYTERTLAKLACVGRDGPPMEYVGRFPYYPQAGLDEWASAKFAPRVSSTIERRAQKSEA